MSLTNFIDFVSRECKNYTHDLCIHSWQGLGIRVYCNCYCHQKKGELEKSFQRDSNSILQSSSQEESDPDGWFDVFSEYRVPINYKEPCGTTGERRERAWVLNWNRGGNPPYHEKKVTNEALRTVLNSKLNESKNFVMNVTITSEEIDRRVKKWENTLAFFNGPQIFDDDR